MPRKPPLHAPGITSSSRQQRERKINYPRYLNNLQISADKLRCHMYALDPTRGLDNSGAAVNLVSLVGGS